LAGSCTSQSSVMFEPLYHTWLGGFIVHCVLVSAWVVGALMMVVVPISMADFTYGASLLLFGGAAMGGTRNRQAMFIAWLSLCAIAGPRDKAVPGFWRFWSVWTSTAFFSWPLVVALRAWPAFLQLFFDLDGSKYYANCELRGALDDVQKEGSCFAFHPHGILCSGFSMNGIWSKAFHDIAGSNTKFGIDKVLREDNLFMKTIADWHGSIMTLDKGSMNRQMAQQNNIAFVPGGFQDATSMKHGVDSTVMRKRTGFIKYALQYGYRIHPCYTFGECNCFYTFPGLLRFRLWLNEYGVPAVVFFGFRWWPLLPRWKVQLYTYLGKAVQLPKITKPTSNEVEHWHGVYIDSLRQLFEEHKVAAGLPPSAKLSIL